MTDFGKEKRRKLEGNLKILAGTIQVYSLYPSPVYTKLRSFF
jgi:hypothetical protein